MSKAKVDLSKVRNSTLMGEVERRLSPERRKIQEAKRLADAMRADADKYLVDADTRATGAEQRLAAAKTELENLKKRIGEKRRILKVMPASILDTADLVGRDQYIVLLTALLLLRRAGGKVTLPTQSPEFLYNSWETIDVSRDGDEVTIQLKSDPAKAPAGGV